MFLTITLLSVILRTFDKLCSTELRRGKLREVVSLFRDVIAACNTWYEVISKVARECEKRH